MVQNEDMHPFSNLWSFIRNSPTIPTHSPVMRTPWHDCFLKALDEDPPKEERVWVQFWSQVWSCGSNISSPYSVGTFFTSHSHITQMCKWNICDKGNQVSQSYIWVTQKCYNTSDTTVHKTHTVQSTLRDVCASMKLYSLHNFQSFIYNLA